MNENNIKTWLIPKLRRRNLTLEKFSKRCGLSRATLYSYMTDRYRPTEETMMIICKALTEIPYWEHDRQIIDKVTLGEGLAQYTPRKNGRRPLNA